jgi:hypothetical protein
MISRNKNKRLSLAAIFFSIMFILAGCSSKSADNRSNFTSIGNAKLIYEETLSPNKEYVTSEEDVVNYYIKIYQDKNFKIIVDASSNSPLSKEQQYTLNYDKQIGKEDIAVSWTTLMGNSEAKENDQFAVAKVSISNNGVVFSERKINFAKNAIDIVVDTINHNK